MFFYHAAFLIAFSEHQERNVRVDPSWWGASDSFWQPLHAHNAPVQMRSWRLTVAFKRRGSAMKCDWNWHIMLPLFTNCNCWELFHFHLNQTNIQSLKFCLYATFYMKGTTKTSKSPKHNQIGSPTRVQTQQHTHTPARTHPHTHTQPNPNRRTHRSRAGVKEETLNGCKRFQQLKILHNISQC